MEMDQPQSVQVSRKEIVSVIDILKKEVAAERCNYIKRKIEENKQNLVDMTNHLYQSSSERSMNGITDASDSTNLLEKRRRDAIGMHNCIDNNVEGESNNSQEDGHSSTAVLLGSSIPVRNAVRPIKLPAIQRLPPYTTWTFLNRNQRMTEDQSVVGRRRIYYDQSGGEALICSDSEEEHNDEEEEKKAFLQSEDYILRNAVEKFGLLDQVLDVLAQCFSRTTVEVKERYEVLVKKEHAAKGDNIDATDTALEKDLDAALDSFDNLFCRRCLVFDCRLHGCSQELVFPAEKPSPWSLQVQDNTPCGPNCYQMVLKAEKAAPLSDRVGMQNSSRIKCSSQSDRSLKTCQSGSTSFKDENVIESVDSGTEPVQDTTSAQRSSPTKSKLARKSGSSKRNSKRVAERIAICLQKRQKKMEASNLDSIASEVSQSTDTNIKSDSPMENEDAISSSYKSGNPKTSGRLGRKKSPTEKVSEEGDIHDGPSKEMTIDSPRAGCDETLRKEKMVDENMCKEISNDDNSWKILEKSLFDKGVEIFGRNSCLIANNMLDGMKTCWQIYQYMNCSENRLSCESDAPANSFAEGNSKGNGEVRRRSRFLRRRGKVRRLKYTWKTAAYNSIRKRISERKDQPCRQYNPCNCQGPCGKQCPCLQNGTCCEKYCGCAKHCKIRFRGCHCAKSQCRSRQCPCFAADRECDPDVCRNCWVSCGDGSLGVPHQRGDNYECRNMKLLLKQQQRVLLGRSNVSGWGAFLKNNVAKHEYLGEYTGELISHREADKRGKIYDRENSSFLFNLNDQFVLDAYRKGDKLKFANHSPDPNCYAKVMMVAGDHRVGIFAKERINAGEELFYDYRYDPDRAPVWARKPDAGGSRKEDGAPSSGRARKHT